MRLAESMKRLKKAKFDLKQGDERAKERVKYHEQMQLMHKLTYGNVALK